MRKVFVGLFMMLALSSFVFAASSEIVTDFNIGIQTEETSKYVSSKSIVGDFLGYIVLGLIILAFVYFALKKKSKKKKPRKKVSKKKPHKKKSSKKKKASKSKK